ncbi:MAG: carbonic anhydrase family protein [Candidatus Poribacteria bacterium]|nr:carbonic anhydrase family protein [Candidatus Poribacteria bacterium]
MNENKKEKKVIQHIEPVCWGYEAENGPDVWERLSPEYQLCGAGIHQSPIDLVNPTPTKLLPITFNYQPTSLNIHNTGNTITVAYQQGSWIEVDATKYHLLEFHFHAPSEHTVAGDLSDMEMHLVHESENGTLAVIGVLIKSGRINTAFNPFWEYLPSTIGESKQNKDVILNAYDLLPSRKHTYRYTGSLTTPPCSEGVKWFVLTTPIEMSHSQVAAFKSIMSGNNRPVQPLNGRKLIVDSTERKDCESKD